MSDIPIGSPPVPPGRHAAPQGWYPDPVDHTRERYWDGWSWSRNTRESQRPDAYEQVQHQQLPAGWRPQSGQTPPHQDPYQHGPYQQAPYQHGPYQPGPSQQGPYQHGPYEQGPYQQGPYQQGPYQQQPYPQPPRQASGQPGSVPLTADGVPIASWGWRFLAGLLDLIIVFIVADIFSLPILVRMIPVLRRYFEATLAAAQHGTAAPTISATDLFTGTEQTLITVISLTVGLLYFTLFWRFKAATPAQLLCGLRIVPADHGTDTERLPWPTALVRALAWWVPIGVSNVLLIFAVVNVLFPLGNAKRQAIHDLAARTQVVKIR